MKKILTILAMTFLLALNSHAVINPNTPIGQNQAGQTITYKEFEILAIKNLLKEVKKLERNNEEIEAWDFIVYFDSIRCDIAEEVLSKAQKTKGLGDIYYSEIFDALTHISEKCFMKEKSIFKAE